MSCLNSGSSCAFDYTLSRVVNAELLCNRHPLTKATKATKIMKIMKEYFFLAIVLMGREVASKLMWACASTRGVPSRR